VTSLVPTPEQRQAIEAPLAPLLVVAGAGTGKTTVMAHRILWLVSSQRCRPDEVLGLTFTNKASHNLKERVREVLGPDADVTIATYHSFGASLVADHRLELDLDPGTQVLNRAQSWQLLYAVFDEFRFHMSLTGRVPDEWRASVIALLHDRFNGRLDEGLDVDALALFVEPDAKADFGVHALCRLGRD